MMSVGRFILLNNILCKTAGDDGAFCPSQIFGHITAETSKDDLGAAKQSEVSPSTTADNSTEEPHAAPVVIGDPNSFVVHIFGMVSNSVLLDTSTRTAIDASDEKVYVPSFSLKESVAEIPSIDSVQVPEKRKKKRCSRKVLSSCVSLSNLNFYKGVKTRFNKIMAEAHYTLCSTAQPLHFMGTTATPLIYPRALPSTVRFSASWRFVYAMCQKVGATFSAGNSRKSWALTIKAAEHFRTFAKRRRSFLLSYSVWTSNHNFYPQLKGKRVSIRIPCNISEEYTELGGMDVSTSIFHPFFPLLCGKRPIPHQKISFLKRKYRRRENNLFYSLASTFGLARAELRKPITVSTVQRGIFFNDFEGIVDKGLVNSLKQIWLMFQKYIICFGVREVATEEGLRYVFESRTFSSKAAYELYCANPGIDWFPDETTYSSRSTKGSTYISSFNSSQRSKAWSDLWENDRDELISRVSEFSSFLLLRKERSSGTV